MSQQEDDLRALAKIMDMMRAVSIVLVLAHLYWFTRMQPIESGWFFTTVNKILNNFNNTCGLFASVWPAKWYAIVLLALSCFGTKGVKNEKIKWLHIGIAIGIGILLFLFNWWMLKLGWSYTYICTTIMGYISLMMGGVWMSRMLKNNMMDDRFNDENESFQQETLFMENEYSINLPTRFYYKKRWNKGWINVVNPFRGT